MWVYNHRNEENVVDGELACHILDLSAAQFELSGQGECVGLSDFSFMWGLDMYVVVMKK